MDTTRITPMTPASNHDFGPGSGPHPANPVNRPKTILKQCRMSAKMCYCRSARRSRDKRLRRPMDRLDVRDGPRMLTRWPGPHAYGARPSPYSAGHRRRSERAAMVPAAAAAMRGLRDRVVALPLIGAALGLQLSSRRGQASGPTCRARCCARPGLPRAPCPRAWPVRAGGAMRSAESAARRPDRAAAASAAAESRTRSGPQRWQAPRRWRRVPSPHRHAALPV
jgi:hypothetical protein